MSIENSKSNENANIKENNPNKNESDNQNGNSSKEKNDSIESLLRDLEKSKKGDEKEMDNKNEKNSFENIEQRDALSLFNDRLDLDDKKGKYFKIYNYIKFN